MFRKVEHIGGRTKTASGGLAPFVMTAMPVFRNERVAWLEGEYFVCQTGDDAPEQPARVTFFVGYIPGLILNQGVTTALLESAVVQHLFGGDMTEHPEPNSASADESEWLRDNTRSPPGARRRYRKEHVTSTVRFGASTTNAIFGKHQVAGKFKLKGGRFGQLGVVVSGFYAHAVPAQTDFGVAELDDQVDMLDLNAALGGGDVTAGTDEAKIQSLIYGGDTFIEADTWKDLGEARFFVRASAGFTGLRNSVVQ